MTIAIDTSDLTRRFRRTEAVNGLTMQIPTGSIFALLGPNGAGKTTTIKLLMNLLRPSRGTARILGVDSQHLSWRDFQRIGYVSETQKLPEWLTAEELLAYCKPMYPGWDDQLAAKLWLDLGIAAAQKLRHLSRGTRMKAALLSSLAYRPELVVLDEPFTGLDPLVRDELIRALLETSDDRTVLVSSHDIDEIERLADWIGFINDGRLLLAEPVSSILARFRLVEVIDAESDRLPAEPRWIAQGTAGRTLRFIDTDHASHDAAVRIAAAFPSAGVRTSPMPLRDIFVTLARRAAASPAERV